MKSIYYRHPSAIRFRQRGSAIVLALFILVVLALLAISLIRMLADSSRSVATEVYGARAFLAAQSGLDLALVSLFPLANGEGVGCGSVPANDGGRFAAQNGLVNCSVTIQCNSVVAPAPDGQTYYRLTSEGVCQAGTGEEAIDVARTLEVEARGLTL